MKKKYIYFLFLMIIIGCANNKNKKKTSIKAQFNIDLNLLDSIPYRNSDLNISLNIPKDWKTINSDLLNIVNTILLVDEYKNADLEVGYFNPKDTSFVIIIDLKNVDKSYLSELHYNYNEILNKNNTLQNIQFQEFNHNCFQIEQYVLQNENVLSFKLICNENLLNDKDSKKFEIMYLINRNKLNENIKSIESSIGSLKCITL